MGTKMIFEVEQCGEKAGFAIDGIREG